MRHLCHTVLSYRGTYVHTLASVIVYEEVSGLGLGTPLEVSSLDLIRQTHEMHGWARWESRLTGHLTTLTATGITFMHANCIH
jgi:hypothetical protein